MCVYVYSVSNKDRVFPKVRKVHVGHDTNFLCQGRKGQIVIWMRYGSRLPPEYQNRYLQLRNVSLEDYGQYICIGYWPNHSGISFSAEAYLKIIGNFLCAMILVTAFRLC